MSYVNFMLKLLKTSSSHLEYFCHFQTKFSIYLLKRLCDTTHCHGCLSANYPVHWKYARELRFQFNFSIFVSERHPWQFLTITLPFSAQFTFSSLSLSTTDSFLPFGPPTTKFLGQSKLVCLRWDSEDVYVFPQSLLGSHKKRLISKLA